MESKIRDKFLNYYSEISSCQQEIINVYKKTAEINVANYENLNSCLQRIMDFAKKDIIEKKNEKVGDQQVTLKDLEDEWKKIISNIRSDDNAEISESRDQEIKEGIIIFYLLCTIYRRHRLTDAFGAIIKKAEMIFEEWEEKNYDGLFLLPYQRLVYEKFRKDVISYDIVECIWNDEASLGNFNVIKYVAHIYHAYADIIVSGFEDEVYSVTKHKDLLKDVEKKMQKFIESKYVTFYFTYGRLLMFDPDICDSEAKKYIKLAMVDENSKNLEKRGNDYMLRMIRYEATLTKIELHNERQEIEAKIKELDEKQGINDKVQKDIASKQKEISNAQKEIGDTVKDLQRQTLEILGFFTALLSFIISGVNIVSKSDTLQDKVQLILVLAIGLVFAFGCFRFMFLKKKQQEISTNEILNIEEGKRSLWAKHGENIAFMIVLIIMLLVVLKGIPMILN